MRQKRVNAKKRDVRYHTSSVLHASAPIPSSARFAIIAGASKAGTTSVFSYLERHPQICPSRAKETRFFLDADYPLPSEARYGRNGPGAYMCFFKRAAQVVGRWCLEATPDYLYSKNGPQAIRDTLGEVRLIFLLREPVSRLMSFYRFGVAMHEIPRDMSFDDYVGLQRNNTGPDFPEGYRHPAFCALQHGRYSMYLERFLQLFNRSYVHVGFQEDLSLDPSSVMNRICAFLGIDGRYFEGYSFRIANKGVDTRNPYLHRQFFEAQQRAAQFIFAHHEFRLITNTPAILSILRRAVAKINAAYARCNVLAKREIRMSPETREFITSYYRDEPQRLKQLLGIEIPWRQMLGRP